MPDSTESKEHCRNLTDSPKKGGNTGCVIAASVIGGLVLLGILLIDGLLSWTKMQYNRKINLDRANYCAKTISDVADTVLEDMREIQDVESVTFLIASSGKDAGVPDGFDAGTFRDAINKHLTMTPFRTSETENGLYPYFLVVENGQCIYAVVEREHTIGTFPDLSRSGDAADCRRTYIKNASFYQLYREAVQYAEDAAAGTQNTP